MPAELMYLDRLDCPIVVSWVTFGLAAGHDLVCCSCYSLDFHVEADEATYSTCM